MNRFTRSVLKKFQSASNQEYLRSELVGKFNDPQVFKYVEGNMDDMVGHFAHKYEIEMFNSDPLDGMGIDDQIYILNCQFLEDRVHFIKSQVLGEYEIPEMYVLHDGGPVTSRNGLAHFQQRADNILDSWRVNSGVGMTTRSDVQADTYATNPFYYSSDDMYTGVKICDQKNLGVNQHMEALYNDTNFKLLNTGKLWGGAFGDGSKESNEKLLSRRIFRSEGGVDNGIPLRRLSIQRRHIDRNVDEGLEGREYDCLVRGYDMNTLYKRVDERRKYDQAHPHMLHYS